MKVYVQSIKNDVLCMLNDTGSDIDQNEFVVLHGFNCVAENDVLNGEYGAFEVEEGIQVQAADFKAGEDTFGTLGDLVCFDPITSKLSDQRKIGYTFAGLLTEVKNADGVIVFDKFRYAQPVEPDET